MDPSDLLVGITLDRLDIVEWEPRLVVNELMYIGPNADGMPPSWQDERFAYCRRNNTVPIIGCRIDGDGTKYDTLIQHFGNLPSWFPLVYVTEHAMPEVDYDGNHTSFIDNYRDWYLNVIQQLHPLVRAKVKAGPVLDNNWTIDPEYGAGNYSRFDPGLAYSDFYGMNFLVDPGRTYGDEFPDEYPTGSQLLEDFKGYRISLADTRQRIIPLIGAIGLPADTTGSDRGSFIFSVFDEMTSWTTAAQGWTMVGASWFNGQGRPGTPVPGIGPSRFYQLDVRQSGFNVRSAYPDPIPIPLYAMNEAAIEHSFDPAQIQPGTPPEVTAPALPPTTIELPPGGLPVDTPASARLLAADYMVLVTDPNLVVLGDPIYDWTSLQCTIRWKEPGSGAVVVPASHYVRQQLVPGSRIVIIRRVLGTQHILLAGPVEKVLRERSDDGENGGVGMLTINFVEDLAWLAARVAFPDPSKPIDLQTTDYWNFSGDPEMAMLTLVATQAGPSALPQRRVPKLRVAPYSGVAGTGTVALGDTSDVAPRERLELLTDVLRKIAVLGANPPGTTPYHPDSLGFRTRQTQIAGENVILFEPVRSLDLRSKVQFSFARGNLEYYSFELGAPSLTHPMVGGQGEGSDRALREIPTLDTGTLAWGRFEGYLAQPGGQSLALAQAAAAQDLAEKAMSSRLATNASDTVDQRYGVHYNIGDVVSVELDADEYETAPIQTVNLQAYPTAGEVVGVTIGDQSARYDSAWAKRMSDLESRVGRQERR